MIRWIVLSVTHLGTLFVGFALGIYLLPILTAPEGPDEATLAATAEGALFTASFTRDLRGSDLLHWGEGQVSITPQSIVHEGRLSPGPDYKVYLVTEFVEDEEQFLRLKADSPVIGDVKTFDGFIVSVPEGVDVTAYTTVLVWCESFDEFITAAQYR